MNTTRGWFALDVRRFAPFQRLAALIVALGLTQCTPESRPADAGHESAVSDASTPVGTGRLRITVAQGGRLRSADGLFELYVPAGAIAADTEFTVTKLEGAAVPADVAAARPASGVYAVEPDGLRFVGDGAYARYTIPTVPEGTISNDDPPEYRSMTAVTRAASGGAIEHEIESATLFERGTRRASVTARLAHLSLKFAISPGDGNRVLVAADLEPRTIGIGPRTSYTTRIGYQAKPDWSCTTPTTQHVGVVVPVERPLIAERFGTTEPAGTRLDFGVSTHTAQWWTSPVDRLYGAFAMPAPTLYCDAPGANNDFVIATRARFRTQIGPMEDDFETLWIGIQGYVSCVAGAPDWDGGVLDAPSIVEDATTDAGGDVGADVRAEGGTMDVATSDASSDAGPCPNPIETRCGARCVDLGTDVDHCGRCDNVCPTVPSSTRECSMGTCRFRCVPNFGDCDRAPSNGCETSLTQPGNCGACGRSPEEVCNGVDDNCDGRADEGCPRAITVPTTAPVAGRVIGAGTGTTRESPACAPPRIATGIYGQERDGALLTVGFLCGEVSLEHDHTVTPFRFNFTVAGHFPTNTVGIGSAFGEAFAYECPTHTVLTRLTGTADGTVNSIQAICSAFSVYRASDGVWSVAEMAASPSREFGTAGGAMFDENPPAGASRQSIGGIFSNFTGAITDPAPGRIANLQFSHRHLVLELN